MLDEATKQLVDEKIIPENAPELSANDKYEQYKQNGLKTWNQKLKKGQRLMIPHSSGEPDKYQEGYIDGFWYKGNLQDEDTYEEGKDNLWHDWRGIQLRDRNGKVWSINANQIKELLEAEDPKKVLKPGDVYVREYQAEQDMYEPKNKFQRLSKRPENISNNGWYYEGGEDDGYVHDRKTVLPTYTDTEVK